MDEKVIKFRKMHGCGNDYITLNCFKEKIDLTSRQINFLCTPHFGIGSEGLLMALPSDRADFRMQMFNIDGSEAEMCGNGIRCVSKFARDEGIVNRDKFFVETKVGIKSVELVGNDVKVNMGKAEFLKNPAKEYDLYCVSMGNPHAVMIVDNVESFPVHEIGAKIEVHTGFPNRTNVEFAQIINRKLTYMRVWERGCGETFACGTGSCATFATLNRLGLLDNDATIKLKGGILKTQLLDGEIFMTGNAINVYDGAVSIPSVVE
jgi:diaminopimelate epimerase